VVSEEEGRALDSSVNIVALILLNDGRSVSCRGKKWEGDETNLVGVNTVVDECPGNTACVEGEADSPVHCPGDGRPSEKCTPVECKACQWSNQD
jgi:hypothetical protein